MRLPCRCVIGLSVYVLSVALALGQAPPRVLDERLELSLFAASPHIVTPTGCAIDARGRLLVIESHTHKRAKTYAGPERDRIRLVVDTDGDGRGDRFHTFFEGTESTMALLAGSEGWLYIATRNEIFRIRDADGDDQAEQRERIAWLETKADYPHNGLCGLCWDPHGRLLFGIGENSGLVYEMRAAKSASLHGSSEGGLFRCQPDGSGLERLASGFWNPFGVGVDPHGRMFVVDNDPDGSPPCRLLHIVPGGDYGYDYRYGRTGKHPLQAWNGELPGTLPMLAGTGEAPCAVLPWHGRLWVSSWGENRIERYQLLPLGASFRAAREIVVQGDKNFRPVGFALSADGSLYLTDWVLADYPVHGQGKIWRLKWKSPPPEDPLPPPSEAERRAQELRSRPDVSAFDSEDPFLRQAAASGFATAAAELPPWWEAKGPARRLGLLSALRLRLFTRRGPEPIDPPVAALGKALADESPLVRQYALRWVADERLAAHRSAVAAQRDFSGLTPELFLSALATGEWLDSQGQANTLAKDAAGALAKAALAETTPPAVRRAALRLTPADHPLLTEAGLGQLLAASDAALAREAVRTLVARSRPDRGSLLLRAAADGALDPAARADAAAGLQPQVAEQAALLERLVQEGPDPVRAAAREALAAAKRGALTSQPPADDLEAWERATAGGGDAERGWRIFFGARATRCAGCHRLEGRGAGVGPDLTGIVGRMSRRRVLESILQPSREIAPQFVSWTLETTDGRVLRGLSLGVDEKDQRERFLAADGSLFEVAHAEIETRAVSRQSIMPDGLHQALTAEELRDLLAALSGPGR